MFIWTQFIDQLPVDLLAQLVERCTGIAEVMGSNSYLLSFMYGFQTFTKEDKHCLVFKGYFSSGSSNYSRKYWEGVRFWNSSEIKRVSKAQYKWN